MIKELLPWAEPLEVAREFTAHEEYWIFLYSGQQLAHTGQYSYLALYPEDSVTGHTFTLLADKLSHGGETFDNAWFGYIGYEMLHDVEELPRETNSHIKLPDLYFIRFGLILQFDHKNKVLNCYRKPSITLPKQPNDFGSINPICVESVTSPISKSEYDTIIDRTKEAITRGDFYQANITRKFIGRFSATPDILDIFAKLSNVSPAAYSACMRISNKGIISSSPERFLNINSSGYMTTMPIKGTAARMANQKQDDVIKQQLQLSIKDRAENLMIVDLMRNDLSRSAMPGSIKVERLFDIDTYATLHHMASTITGQKRSDVSTLDVVRYCFPPGSMTGTPKISAIEWCKKQERIQRGVYSGALGWFGGDGSCDLSVVIRTLIVDGPQFEFQVGGGIVADSTAEQEWKETLTKARGIALALGIDHSLLENI